MCGFGCSNTNELRQEKYHSSTEISGHHILQSLLPPLPSPLLLLLTPPPHIDIRWPSCSRTNNPPILLKIMRSQLHAHIKRGMDSERSNCCVTVKLCRQLYICILQRSPLQGSVWELKEERSSYKRLGGMRVEVKAGPPRLSCWTPPTHVSSLQRTTSCFNFCLWPFDSALGRGHGARHRISKIQGRFFQKRQMCKEMQPKWQKGCLT